MTTAGPDVAIITMKVTADVTCDGKKDPSPVISSSVYVRSGDTWKGAYHNEVPVIEQKAAATKPEAPAAKTNPANEKTETAEKGDKAEKKESAGKTETANKTATADAKLAADTAGDPLVVIEKAGWEAWKARDAKKLDELTSKDFLGVDMMGTVLATKADAIKAWTEPKCDIKNVDVSDGQSVSLGKDASLLTFKGTASGMCEGQKLGALWGTSVFVKEGDAWKLVFMFETPA
jgi:hypothetical protein